jgi:hypothetical protein
MGDTALLELVQNQHAMLKLCIPEFPSLYGTSWSWQVEICGSSEVELMQEKLFILGYHSRG